MHGEDIPYAYGFWFLVLVNVGLFAFFILSFLTPVKKREWRSMGVTLAFFVALFTEMYGFPLTIYILTGILGSKYPALNPFSHAAGHLWLTFLGGGTGMMGEQKGETKQQGMMMDEGMMKQMMGASPENEDDQSQKAPAKKTPPEGHQHKH